GGFDPGNDRLPAGAGRADDDQRPGTAGCGCALAQRALQPGPLPLRDGGADPADVVTRRQRVRLEVRPKSPIRISAAYAGRPPRRLLRSSRTYVEYACSGARRLLAADPPMPPISRPGFRPHLSRVVVI